MMLRVSSPLCGSCVEYALDAVFISVEKTPTSFRWRVTANSYPENSDIFYIFFTKKYS